MDAESVTVEDCDAHIAERRVKGTKDGTLSTELGRLRMVLVWAEKRKYIAKAPYIKKPSAPKRREDHHLTRQQVAELIKGATMPHLAVFVILAIGTGARREALLSLTWDRVDFTRNLIDLRDPDLTRPHKGRAIVPMNRMVRAALLEAQKAALSGYVVEWRGDRVQSVKKGLKASAAAAGIVNVSVGHHILRHSAAVHMAEAGIDMEEIAQFLGHEDVETTRRIYARFSTHYLRKAASVLEHDDLAQVGGVRVCS